MRRLARQPDTQSGAIGITVAILLVVLLGFLALALDVARLYAEKAQLQNGADAAALSVAHICAESTDNVSCASDSVDAETLANENAIDGLSSVKDLEVDKSSGTIAAHVVTHEPGKDPNEMSLMFANVLGFSSASVGASALARWGGPSAGPAPFSIAFSQCEIDSGVTSDGSMQFLRAHGVGTSDKACTSTSSGQELPGGFGWLVQEPDKSCAVNIDLAVPIETGDPGSNFKPGCEKVLTQWKHDLSAGKPVIAFFPIFDQIIDGKQYHIEAFAAFDVRGWNFYNGDGTFALSEAVPYMPSSGYSQTGFVGQFVGRVAIDNSMEFGGSTKYGAKIVSLVE